MSSAIWVMPIVAAMLWVAVGNVLRKSEVFSTWRRKSTIRAWVVLILLSGVIAVGTDLLLAMFIASYIPCLRG